MSRIHSIFRAEKPIPLWYLSWKTGYLYDIYSQNILRTNLILPYLLSFFLVCFTWIVNLFQQFQYKFIRKGWCCVHYSSKFRVIWVELWNKLNIIFESFRRTLKISRKRETESTLNLEETKKCLMILKQDDRATEPNRLDKKLYIETNVW